MKYRALQCLTISGCLALATTAFAQKGVDIGDRDTAPNGKGIGTTQQHGPANNNPGQARTSQGTGSNGIYYHCGPVMVGTKSVYFIWYGNWAGNSATTIVTNLASSIGGSSYFNINTTYTNGSGMAVSNSVAYNGSTTDTYSHGTSLSDSNIQSIVAAAITSGKLPLDTSGVYFVLTSQDVNETSGFRTQYCGWHTYGTVNGLNLNYAFVGNTNWRNRPPHGMTAAVRRTPTSAPGLSEPLRRRRTARNTTSHWAVCST